MIDRKKFFDPREGSKGPLPVRKPGDSTTPQAIVGAARPDPLIAIS